MKEAPPPSGLSDADKEAYDFYYETLLPFVRTGGLILFDNMLRGGQVVHPVEKNTPANRAISRMADGMPARNIAMSRACSDKPASGSSPMAASTSWCHRIRISTCSAG